MFLLAEKHSCYDILVRPDDISSRTLAFSALNYGI